MPLKVSDGIRTWIDDFQKSDAPQFKGKTKDERRDQAIAAYLSAKKGPKNEDAAMDKARADFFKRGGKIKKLPTGPKYGHLDTNIAKGVKGLVRTKKLGLKGHGKHLDTSTPVHKDDEKKEGKTNEVLDTPQARDAYKKAAADSHYRAARQMQKNYPGTSQQYKDKKFNDAANTRRKRMAGAAKVIKKSGAAGLGYETQSTNEATNFAVSIEGLPQMFMSADSPGMLKQELRKIVKQPSMIQGVKRVTDAMVKKTFRLKAQGRDEEEQQENYKYDYGSPESIKLMKKITPGQNNTKTEKTYMRTDKKLPNLKVPVKRKLKNVTLAKKIMGQKPKKLRTVADHVKFLEAKDPNEYDKEGSMMKSQLRQIMSANDSLMKMVKDDDNLPEWVQSKITKATDYIRSVRDYLESEKNA